MHHICFREVDFGDAALTFESLVGEMKTQRGLFFFESGFLRFCIFAGVGGCVQPLAQAARTGFMWEPCL